ncbi:SPOC-domain-containing protein [Mollisia scopiformis]|uniref:Transcription factor BYE1 n=1 Tax=Mollisia scopiformis TaxID=149040 RepID=A0A194WXF2_MOLSC|nr:SPOC-domain-containing protein [Mollisia scopiformis]KUJ12661.1 SPOC-domain-containing protein [Mollisia scopiformis]
MADEPRRSVRATKGQHTKSHDVLDQATPEPKKKSTKKAKKVEKEEEAEIIRCVCGALESPDGDEDPWIACDNCNVWQHNVCVGLPTYDEDIPKNYLCEECDPEFHKELLDAVANGVKIWEQRRKTYEKMKADEEKEKKKGKGKKGKRPSDPKSEVSHTTNGKAKSPSTPVPAEAKKEKKEVAKGSSTKRKNRGDSQDKESAKELPPTKSRKVSAAHTTPRQDSPITGLTVKILDLESARQAGATLVNKGLAHALPIAVKNGIYVLRENDTIEAKAERLAIEVEDAIHATHPDKGSYSKQSRAIFNNLKHNQELCNGLLTRTLSPHDLATMTTDDMASKELKRETAEMKARADKQSIMVSDDGPRVRRTHKGEEVIEGDNFAVANDNTMSTSRRRSMLDPNADMAARSRENSPGTQVELPDINSYRSQDDIRGHVVPKHPLNIETKTGLPMRKPSGQADFDINKVFSNVPSQSPVSAHHTRTQSISNAPPANGPGNDPEIDRMLEDDGNESEPYSPAEYKSDPDIVWRGTVVMDSIAKFPADAKHVAGVDISRTLAWADVLQKELKVAGRIDREKANEYLCSLRYSPPTDVVVVNVTPAGDDAAQGFQELYDYFQSKNRYGVLANKGIGNIRDTYLVPVPPSPANLPDFIVNLEGHKIAEDRSEPMIVIALVIRNEGPDLGRSFDGTSDVHSPTVKAHPQRQMSIGGAGPAMSPIAPQGQGTFPTPPIPQQQFPSDDTQRRYQQEQERAHAQREGETNALKILGTFAEAPTVAFLMPQAFQMREVEWQIIRGILEEDDKARVDLQHLSQVLEVRMSQYSQSQQSN